MCFNMAKSGECAHGENCLWLHDNTAAEKARVEAMKARRRAKGKGRGKGKPNAAAAPASAAWDPLW